MEIVRAKPRLLVRQSAILSSGRQWGVHQRGKAGRLVRRGGQTCERGKHGVTQSRHLAQDSKKLGFWWEELQGLIAKKKKRPRSHWKPEKKEATKFLGGERRSETKKGENINEP